jgi:hypothetical protein
MRDTTRAAIQEIAVYDNVEEVWELILPLSKRSLRVPISEGDVVSKVCLEFGRWCHDNSLTYNVAGDGDEIGFFYVEGLRFKQ